MKVFPVVHVLNTEQAQAQSNIAFDHGADGIYLISHSSSQGSTNTLRAFEVVKQEHEDEYVGVNLLLNGPDTAFRALKSALSQGLITTTPDGIWVDEAATSPKDLSSLSVAEKLRNGSSDLAGIRFLGGVAFKYTRRYTDDPVQAAADTMALAPFMDVVTTSGPGTGFAPTPDKIYAMKQAAGNKPLAVASGISSDNIHEYGDCIDEILVASSVETEPYSGIFNPTKLAEFISLAKE